MKAGVATLLTLLLVNSQRWDLYMSTQTLLSNPEGWQPLSYINVWNKGDSVANLAVQFDCRWVLRPKFGCENRVQKDIKLGRGEPCVAPLQLEFLSLTSFQGCDTFYTGETESVKRSPPLSGIRVAHTLKKRQILKKRHSRWNAETIESFQAIAVRTPCYIHHPPRRGDKNLHSQWNED